MSVHYDIIERLLHFAQPEISRGPSDKEWLRVMRDAAEILSKDKCLACHGREFHGRDLCNGCRGVGYDLNGL